MTVQLDVPTGAEIHAHGERWKALPEGERPRYPIEKWLPYNQSWEGRILRDLSVAIHRIPDDDTPQPGLRLVALPVAPETERVPSREAVGRTHACGRSIDSITTRIGVAILRDSEGEVIKVVYSHVGTVEVLVEPESAAPSVQSPSASAGGEAEAESHEGFEGASEAPAGECSGSPATDHAEAQVHHLVDEYGLAGVMKCLRTHDDWLDAPSTDGGRFAVPDTTPEPWTPQVGDRVRYERYERRWLPKRVVHVHEGWAWVDEEGAEWWHRIVPLSSLHPWTERDGES